MVLDRPITVLVIGGGGREHALCWKIAQSQLATRIYCAPGNGGTATTAKVENADLSLSDFPAIVEFCREKVIDLVVVGPDNPLADGIVDVLEEAGLRVFGPLKQSARLEWSKVYAKEFLTRHGIPTARYAVCDSFESGREIVHDNPWARVVKVDGLALGKGVFVCDTGAEAVEALSDIFQKDRFGAAGTAAVIEERLEGEEVSLLALCDGKSLVPLLPSQDHKRRFDGDRGPNTGGMGACAPVELYRQCDADIETRILEPIRRSLQSGKLVYKGVLYIGLMIAGAGPKEAAPRGPYQPYVLEFNARFGDPETQAILPLLKSDLLAALWACTESSLHEVRLQWETGAACCVVATAGNYPEGSSRGETIEFGELPAGSVAFHAGTRLVGSQILTNGGRVLAVTGTGPSLEAARQAAYSGIAKISFANMDYRRDIAKRALAACQST